MLALSGLAGLKGLKEKYYWALAGLGGLLSDLFSDAIKTLWRLGIEKTAESAAASQPAPTINAPDLNAVVEYLAVHWLSAIGFFCLGVAASLHYLDWRRKKADAASTDTPWAGPEMLWGHTEFGTLKYLYSTPEIVRHSWAWNAGTVYLLLELSRSMGKPKVKVACSDAEAEWEILNYGSDSVGVSLAISMSSTSTVCVHVMPEEIDASVERNKQGKADYYSAEDMKIAMDAIAAQYSEKNEG